MFSDDIQSVAADVETIFHRVLMCILHVGCNSAHVRLAQGTNFFARAGKLKLPILDAYRHITEWDALRATISLRVIYSRTDVTVRLQNQLKCILVQTSHGPMSIAFQGSCIETLTI